MSRNRRVQTGALLRLLVLLLLLANLVYLAWSQGWLRAAGLGPQPQSDPAPQARQIRPEMLQWLPASAADADPRAASAR